MPVINTNMNALFAQNALQVNARSLSSAMQELSTGSRINSAKDDAAGLAIASTMTSQVRGLNMAAKNGNDAISLLQTAEGAMAQQSAMLQRMRELAVQSASASVSTVNKADLDLEFQALSDQIDQIGANTQWNGGDVLTGLGGSSGLYSFQVGSEAGTSNKIDVTLNNMSTTGTGAKFSAIASSSVDTGTNASSAITALTTALTNLNHERANVGANINRLTYAVDNITNVAQNATEGRSRILDTDYATASSQLAKAQIIQQAATAMLAQANQQPQTVLALLK